MSELPVVWLLLGAKAGDNSQVRELAARLPVTAREIQLTFNSRHKLPNFAVGTSVSTLTAEARSLLAAPWPDAVIAAGKRSAPVARWIKQQSGGRTKLIHIGRPRATLSAFDIVVTTPQYGLPSDANVVELPLPLTAHRSVAGSDLAKWRDEWKDLPRPWFCVAVGAAKFPIRLGSAEAAAMAAKLNSVVGASGGSAIVLASPRSDTRVMSSLATQLSVTKRVYAPFQRSDNPYAAALQLSDKVVVTSDSASMIADALAAGKPVEVFRLPVSSVRVAWNGKRGIGAELSRAGLLQPPRAMARIVDRLLSEGVVSELGGEPARHAYSGSDESLARRIIAVVTGKS